MSYPRSIARPFSRFKEAGPGLIIVALFILTRVVFFVKGGSFLATPISFAKQYLDPVLLENDLLTSLLYLHAQPPLFNFFLGMILKLSPEPAVSFDLLFKTVGILIPLIFYAILIALGLKRFLALMLTAVFMLNPTLILYENLLYYTYFEAFFVLLAIFFLQRWCIGNQLSDVCLFWASLLGLGLIRSLFHPVFFLVTAVVPALYLWRRAKGQRLGRTFFLSSSVVLIPLLVLCLKNVVIYGFLGTSSWAGMSLWIKANGYAPEELQALYSRGIISRLALQAEFDPFQPVKNFFPDDKQKNAACHHPADCNEMRGSGKPNFNHSGYVRVSKQLGKDARDLISRDPGLFAFYTLGSYSLTTWHCSDSVHALFKDNMEIVKKLEDVYRFLYFGFMGVNNRHSDPRLWGRTIAVTVFFLFFYVSTLISLFRKDSPVPLAVKTVCLFCLLIHFYTLAVSSLIEFGENNRFRFPADAAFLVLMAGNIVSWKRLKNKH
jgi:hypothetical protein